MSNGGADLFKNKIVVLVAFVGIAIIIFSASTGRIFLSDDYLTLHNIADNNSILLPSFFRPLGDLTLKWNYLATGWDPFYFYLTNILIHALNSFLVYLVCKKWFAVEGRADAYALIAGLIFLTYPSHSEAILWAIGRGISLAVTFSLLAMIVFISETNRPLKYFLVCTFYFLAMASYESAILLPFILFTMPGRNFRDNKMRWPGLLVFTLLIHVFLRYQFTGGMWQAYNGIIFSRDLIHYLSSFSKIILRLFVPPFNHPLVFTICGVVALVLLFVIFTRNRKKFESDSIFAKTTILVVIGLLVTTIIGVSFGLSTRTSEGDRLLYFPSVFYSVLISLLVIKLISSIKMVVVTAGVILIFQINFLLINQTHWIRASEYAVKVINAIGAHPERPLYIINLPSDHEGAYIFRNGLTEALLHYSIDTAGIKVMNIIQSTEIEERKTLIIPEIRSANIFIWPNTVLDAKRSGTFLFWNKEDLVPVSNYFISR
ncbi:MAG: hypothetical protein H7X71_02825 [Chitinophagales bacterium]|nr:hypothetical protein [Chitinophagales bacterium]